MNKKHIALGMLISGLVSSTALAGVCQVWSTAWAQKKFCGLTSRGYAEGATVLGTKAITSNKTTSTSNVHIEAAGFNSSGQSLAGAGCYVDDWTSTGTEVATGGCASGVKFLTNVWY